MVHAAEQKLNWTEGQASEKSHNVAKTLNNLLHMDDLKIL